MDLGRISAEKIRERLKAEAEKVRIGSSGEDVEKKGLILRALTKTHRFLKRSRIYRKIYDSHLRKLKDTILREPAIDLHSLMQYEGEEFVRMAYREILQREPDKKGLEFYLSKLENGKLRKIEVLISLRFSEEGRKKGVRIRGLKTRYLLLKLIKIPFIGPLLSIIHFIFKSPRILWELETLKSLTFSQFEKTRREILEELNKTRSDVKRLEEALLRLNERRFAINIPSDFYIELENRFRGEESEIEERLSVYIPIVSKLKEERQNVKAVDLGCGRGEWLKMLKNLGIDGLGIDINGEALKICEKKGLNVKKVDALTFLRQSPPSSVDLISAFHLIEHLPFETISDLLDEIKRVLKEGGLLIIETPNPTNILVSSYDFFLDPSHIRPIHPYLIKLLGTYKGFSESEAYFILKSDGKYHLEKAENWQLNSLDDYIRAPRDFCLIARK